MNKLTEDQIRKIYATKHFDEIVPVVEEIVALAVKERDKQIAETRYKIAQTKFKTVSKGWVLEQIDNLLKEGN